MSPSSLPCRLSAMAASLGVLAEQGIVAVAVVRGGGIVATTPRFDQLFGLPEGGGDVRALELVIERERARFNSMLAAAAEGTRGEPSRDVFEAVRLGATLFEAEIVCTNSAVLPGGPAQILVASDASERTRVETQLSYLAFVDPLTGLPNRALLLDRLRETLAAARRDRRVFAVLMCDLDGFKAVNDRLGHEAGDALLQVVAQRLETTVRGNDTFARIGGDEFAAVLPKVASRDDVAFVAARMVQALEAPIEIGTERCKVGISIGIATYPDNAADMDGLLSRADAAMYESKRAGKGRFTYAAVETDHAALHIPAFKWSESHDVGFELMDAQHRGLVAHLNELADDLKAGRDRDTILSTLRALVAYTEKHFAAEERLMDAHPGWPLDEQHRAEHRKLMADLQSLTLTIDVGSMTMTIRFLHEWLVRHIDTTDKPLAAWLRGWTTARR